MENRRADSARTHDDSDLIGSMEAAPAFSGARGGNLQRDIGTRDEIEQQAGQDDGVTRVHASDKQPEADLPRFNDS